MTRRRLLLAAATFALALAAGAVLAQRPYRDRWSGRIPDDRAGVPNWTVDAKFKRDVFTFVRIEYDSFRGGYRRGGGWRVRPRRGDVPVGGDRPGAGGAGSWAHPGGVLPGDPD